ncbi:MAG: histidine phosphatase family protein [Bdellovibrionaceae bacterium]|nr:histidine phosphatase family protein [Pseudobdellovibrionaceae bacterium]
MKLVVLRHAAKGVFPLLDPELTPEGLRQAAELAARTKKSLLPVPTQLLSSPRRRARQTLTPLAEMWGLSVKDSLLLYDRQNDERADAFRLRIRQFIQQMSELDERTVVYCCSHMDWLDEFTALMDCDRDLSDFGPWRTCQYLIFEHQNSWFYRGQGRAE